MTKTEERKVVTRGTGPDAKPIWEKFDDGSARAKCVHCNQWEEIPANAPVFRKPDPFENYTCKRCWKAPEDAKRKREQDRRTADIHWGQAYNLAFQAVLAKNPNIVGIDQDVIFADVENAHALILDHMTGFRARSNQDTQDPEGERSKTKDSTK